MFDAWSALLQMNITQVEGKQRRRRLLAPRQPAEIVGVARDRAADRCWHDFNLEVAGRAVELDDDGEDLAFYHVQGCSERRRLPRIVVPIGDGDGPAGVIGPVGVPRRGAHLFYPHPEPLAPP